MTYLVFRSFFFPPHPSLHRWGFVYLIFFFFNHYWIFKSLLGKFLSSAPTVEIESNGHESAKFCSSLFFLPASVHTEFSGLSCKALAVQEKMLWLQLLLPFLCKLPKVTLVLFLAPEVNHSGKSDKIHFTTVKLSNLSKFLGNFCEVHTRLFELTGLKGAHVDLNSHKTTLDLKTLVNQVCKYIWSYFMETKLRENWRGKCPKHRNGVYLEDRSNEKAMPMFNVRHSFIPEIKHYSWSR